MIEYLRVGKLHEDIEVYHEDVPLNITFIWDPQLTRLPHLLQRWELNTQHRPTLLLLGWNFWSDPLKHQSHWQLFLCLLVFNLLFLDQIYPIQICKCSLSPFEVSSMTEEGLN